MSPSPTSRSFGGIPYPFEPGILTSSTFGAINSGFTVGYAIY